MTILITLTIAGTDTGPFNLYSNLDGYTSAFEVGVAKIDLVAGYISGVVPDGTTIIKVVSDNPICTNDIDIPLTLTTTTTTTIANPATSILRFDNYTSGLFEFTLSNPIYSTNIIVSSATVEGWTSGTECAGETDDSDYVDWLNPIIVGAGSSTASSFGNTPMSPIVQSFKRGITITIDGYGNYVDADTLTIDGTLVTVEIPNDCEIYTSTLFTEYSVGVTVNCPTECDNICITTPITVYTVFGAGIETGVTVYTDSLLNTPLTGFNYILNPNTFHIYTIDSVTGVIGADTLLTCPPSTTTTSTSSSTTTSTSSTTTTTTTIIP